MALEYTLLLSRSEPPTFASSDQLIHASPKVESEPAASWHEADHGIRNGSYVYFRLDKFHAEEAERVLLAMIGVILRQDNDDALLLWNGELPVLRRRHGRIAVSTRWDWIRSGDFALLGLPMEMEDLGGVD